MARALQFKVHLPIMFWGEYVLILVYLINLMRLSSLKNTTPYEKLLGKVPAYEHFRYFGCLCYGHLNRKGYIIYDLGDKSIYVSRDVQFF